ncbi:MAG: phosphatase PAP2/dual specificity phosphatase family protein [Candidatus Accumulibacter sp.]|nr:phosphatase PAP2/dual specificity phosphatase family protein [Accumulibacter sp.]
MDEPASIPWRRGVLWLLFLGPLFFISYGYANALAARWDAAGQVGCFYFEWEKGIPFWPWSIVPYWSIDLLYGLSFLCCRNARETDSLGLRLLSVQVISIACFLFFPLRFAFLRPSPEGVFGALFTLLASFDQPYNQAPSLHIGLLVIVWKQFSTLDVSPRLHAFIHGWALLIGVSVLTTWQHHFIDVPTGLAVGLFCLWLWPDEGASPLLKRAVDAGHWKLAAYYLAGAALSLAAALAPRQPGVPAFLLGWLALALTLVACNYLRAGAAGFQKSERQNTGRRTLASACLFAPYTLAAWINSRCWTRKNPRPDQIADGVWLGRLPTAREFAQSGCAALLDLTAELPAPARVPYYRNLPCLDLTRPSAAFLLEAARTIEALREKGAVLVACALGFSRSAAAVAVWLRLTGRAASMREAVALLAARRPRMALNAAWLELLDGTERLISGGRHDERK